MSLALNLSLSPRTATEKGTREAPPMSPLRKTILQPLFLNKEVEIEQKAEEEQEVACLSAKKNDSKPYKGRQKATIEIKDYVRYHDSRQHHISDDELVQKQVNLIKQEKEKEIYKNGKRLKEICQAQFGDKSLKETSHQRDHPLVSLEEHFDNEMKKKEFEFQKRLKEEKLAALKKKQQEYQTKLSMLSRSKGGRRGIVRGHSMRKMSTNETGYDINQQVEAAKNEKDELDRIFNFIPEKMKYNVGKEEEDLFNLKKLDQMKHDLWFAEQYSTELEYIIKSLRNENRIWCQFVDASKHDIRNFDNSIVDIQKEIKLSNKLNQQHRNLPSREKVQRVRRNSLLTAEQRAQQAATAPLPADERDLRIRELEALLEEATFDRDELKFQNKQLFEMVSKCSCSQKYVSKQVSKKAYH